jgi:hypothetical protein
MLHHNIKFFLLEKCFASLEPFVIGDGIIGSFIVTDAYFVT